MRIVKTKSIIVLTLLLLVAVFVVDAKKATKKETFTGYVRLISGPAPGATGRLTMTVKRWTTDDERLKLLKTLREEGPEALQKEMREMDAGYVRFARTLRQRLNFAIFRKTEKGLFVRLVLERPIFFAEYKYHAARVRDYEFGIIEFLLDEKGKGEGMVIPTAKIKLNKQGNIEIETLGIGPQKLLKVSKK